MARKQITVTQMRKYGVLDVSQARSVATIWINRLNLGNAVAFGLPEVDDRYHVWRVPLLNKATEERLGEVVIDARSSLILEDKSTRPEILEARLLGREEPRLDKKPGAKAQCPVSTIRNIVACGDCEQILQELPAGSVDLVFTSPPYYNARPEYTDYVTYEEYLLKLRKVIQSVHRVLNEGRFFVMNVSPVLIRRASRNDSSTRLAVPFDVHRLFIEEGFDFMDDIIWVKPEGAGWATGRGRRFAADRHPLQYKPVPVTEYILVYRKHTDKLIDWHIRCHPNPDLVRASRIGDDYERTNVWYIKPAAHPDHPAIFPLELAEKVISYYSFQNDVVLDPFAGIGTVGAAAAKLGRRFVLIDQEPKYAEIMARSTLAWLGKAAQEVLFIGCAPPNTDEVLF